MVLQVCAQCGSEYSPARLDAVYCSPACRQRAYRSRNAKTVTAEPEPVPPNRNAEVVTDDRYEQYRAQCDADVAAYKAQLDAQIRSSTPCATTSGGATRRSSIYSVSRASSPQTNTG